MDATQTKTQCDRCRNMITWKIVTDENDNDAEVEVGHDEDCPVNN